MLTASAAVSGSSSIGLIGHPTKFGTKAGARRFASEVTRSCLFDNRAH